MEKTTIKIYRNENGKYATENWEEIDFNSLPTTFEEFKQLPTSIAYGLDVIVIINGYEFISSAYIQNNDFGYIKEEDLEKNFNEFMKMYNDFIEE